MGKDKKEVCKPNEKLGVKLQSVEFIRDRKRTSLIVEVFGVEVITRVTYDGEVGDSGHSNLIGFLYAFYKFAHAHLTSTQLQNKIGMIFGKAKKTYVEAYLTSFFIESGIVSPSKALRVIEKIRKVDNNVDRIKIEL